MPIKTFVQSYGIVQRKSNQITRIVREASRDNIILHRNKVFVSFSSPADCSGYKRASRVKHQSGCHCKPFQLRLITC